MRKLFNPSPIFQSVLLPFVSKRRFFFFSKSKKNVGTCGKKNSSRPEESCQKTVGVMVTRVYLNTQKFVELGLDQNGREAHWIQYYRGRERVSYHSIKENVSFFFLHLS